MIKCSKCEKEYPGVKLEYIGILLLLLIIPYIFFFGIYGSTIIWSILFLGSGIYLVVKRPSKKFICNNCKNQ